VLCAYNDYQSYLETRQV